MSPCVGEPQEKTHPLAQTGRSQFPNKARRNWTGAVGKPTPAGLILLKRYRPTKVLR